MPLHAVADCPQNPTLYHIMSTLDELKEHSARTASALETIAAQGVMVQVLKERVDKHDKDFSELFGRVRVVELKHARESGAAVVEGRKTRFWNHVKANLVPYILGALFTILYIIDKYDLTQKWAKIMKEMKG
jgi:hypothetical protein